MAKESLELKTADGLKLKGDFYPAFKSPPAEKNLGLIFFHMRRRDRTTFWPFIAPFQVDFNVLTFDFRGHGQSPLNFEDFSEKDYQGLLLDGQAAIDYMAKRLANLSLGLLGGSIGANVALLLSQAPAARAVVLLSPGLNYYGLKTLSAAQGLQKPVLMAASRDDKTKTYDAVREAQVLFEASPLKEPVKRLLIFERAGHGTEMLQKAPKLIDAIEAFFQGVMILAKEKPVVG